MAMNDHPSDSVREKLSVLDQEIRKRASLVRFGYSLALAGAILLYRFFPFPLSRAGSVILIIALANMIWKVHAASRAGFQSKLEPNEESLACHLSKVDAQIGLIQSVVHNLPFVVGANLFFMGLPGTGSAERKAWLDCFFLLGTVIVFSSFYFVNQRAVRKQLLPLREELERCASPSGH